jgi:pilus assembly protein FimV
MNKNLRPSVLAPIALLLAFQGAHAMTLGDVQLRSYIGQPFKGDIPYRLNGDERLLEGCYQLRQSSGDATYLGASTVQILPRGDGSTGVIRISSQKAAEEPIVGFALHVQCENINLTRDFTVFLDPAPIVEVPVVAEKTSWPPLRTATEAGKVPPASIVKQDTSLARIAQRYYPPNSAAYTRYLKKLQRSNPDLAVDEVLTPGSEVYIPSRPKPKAKPVLAAHPPTSGGGIAAEASQLRLEGAERSAAVPTTLQGNPEAYVKELEAKVAQLSELRQKLQLEIDALDVKLAHNVGDLNAKRNQVVIAATSAPTAGATSAPAAPAASATLVAANSWPKLPSEEPGMDWEWPTLGLLGLLGGGVWWWVRRRSDNDGYNLSPSQSMISILQTNYSPRWQAETELSLIHNPQSAFQVADDESTGLEAAQFYLARGDTLRALELLQQLLEEDPQDVERWLMLFRVYRQQGMKSDYVQLAQRFRAQEPPPSDDDWELVRSIGYKLEPESLLFARTEPTVPPVLEITPQETPVEFAIEHLQMASPPPDPAASTPAEQLSLINEFQPPAAAAPQPVRKLAPTLTGDEVITVPELSVINHNTDISSLDSFECDVQAIEFDDEPKLGDKAKPE